MLIELCPECAEELTERISIRKHAIAHWPLEMKLDQPTEAEAKRRRDYLMMLHERREQAERSPQLRLPDAPIVDVTPLLERGDA